MIDPLKDIMATAHMDTPIHAQTAKDMGLEDVLAELTRDYLRPALEAAGVENPEQYSLGYETAAYDMKPHPKRYRRPWVPVEQLDATQALPIVRTGE